MIHPNSLKRLAILLLLLLLPITSCAQRPPHEQMHGQTAGQPGQHYGPPPEAIEACKEKQEGDSVTFTGRQGEAVKATCRTMDGLLAALPDDMKDNNRPPCCKPGEKSKINW